MNPISDAVFAILALFIVFTIAWMLTGLVRRLALQRSILDIPGDRSSHTLPTPRGGGLGFSLPFLLVTAIGWWAAHIGWWAAHIGWWVAYGGEGIGLLAALTLGGGIMALLGWMDDVRDLSPRFRFIIQVGAAALALFILGGLKHLELGPWIVEQPLILNGLAIIGMVWMINLYNFMDGIDGIAGSEAITTALGAVAIACLTGDCTLVLLCLLLAASVAGFLAWNWPPARIFMGDTGSAFLGLVFAILSIFGENAGTVPLLAWLIMLALFIVDSTVTLLHRLGRGEKIYQAHREHLYQLAVQAGYSHQQVTTTFIITNLVLITITAVAVQNELLLPTSIAVYITLIGLHSIIRYRLREGIASSASQQLPPG